jgi:hypothetical protein
MLTNYILAGDKKMMHISINCVGSRRVHPHKSVKACGEHSQQMNMLHVDHFPSAPDKNQWLKIWNHPNEFFHICIVKTKQIFILLQIFMVD